VGAKSERTGVPLHYTLRSGDIVEVLTSKQGVAVAGLAEVVRTSPRRNKDRAWFKRERRDDAERHGREQLQQALRNRRPALAERSPPRTCCRRDPRDRIQEGRRLL